MIRADTFSIRKTLIIGLGGTGVSSVLNLKREFYNYFGGVPTIINFLCFDTTRASLEQVSCEQGSRIIIEESERVFLWVNKSREQIMNANKMQKWDLPENKIRYFEIRSGAHQQRTMGRIALLENANYVYDSIRDAIYTIRDIRNLDSILQHPEFEISEDIKTTVYIVCSLAGGTGAGTFLDVAYMCRDILGKYDRLIGVFLLPTIFERYPSTDRLVMNGYASLKELDYLMGGGEQKRIDYTRSIQVQWGGSGNPPFSSVYLIGEEFEDHTKVSGVDQVTRFIGRMLFAHTIMKSPAKIGHDILDDISIDSISDPWKGKYPHYIGIGMSDLYLPIQDVIDREVNTYSHRFIEDFLRVPEETQIDEHVTEFMRRKELPEQGADDVVDFIIPPTNYLELSPCEEPERRKNPTQAILDWRSIQLGKAKTHYRELARRYRERKEKKVKNSIRNKVENSIKCKGCLGYINSFLSSLLTRFQTCQLIIKDEKAYWALRREQVNYPSEEEIDNAKRKFFSRRPLREIAVRDQVAYIEEAKCIWEIVRREEAMNFFGELIGFLKKFIGQETPSGQLVSLRANLAKSGKIFNNAIKSTEFTETLDEFTLHLNEDYFKDSVRREISHVNLDDFLQDCDMEEILAWSQAKPEELADKFRSFIHENLSSLENLVITEVIENALNEQEVRIVRDLKRFVRRTKPLLRVEGPKRRLVKKYILFVPKMDKDSSLKDTFRRMVLPKSTLLSISPMPDSHRIRLMEIQLGVPVTAIKSIRRLERKYSKLEEQESFTYHIRKGWSGPQALPDLFPKKGPEKKWSPGRIERLKYWSVAFAEPVELIRRQGTSHYYVISEEVGKASDNYKFFLGNGRLNALEKFIKEDIIYKEIKDKIDEAIRSETMESIEHAWNRRIKKLRNLPISEGPLKKLIEREEKAIKEFIKDLRKKRE